MDFAERIQEQQVQQHDSTFGKPDFEERKREESEDHDMTYTATYFRRRVIQDESEEEGTFENELVQNPEPQLVLDENTESEASQESESEYSMPH